jgi:uncharacterized protein with FMN-binding domain
MKEIDQVLQYINQSKYQSLEFNTRNLLINVYVDASYAVHRDAKSHSGVLIQIGDNGGTIFVSSKKQKVVTLSSTESELVAVHDGLFRALWIQDICEEILQLQLPVIIYQDNLSTIQLLNSGNADRFKSKHINVRYFYAKEHIKSGRISIDYLPTEDMIADFFTKPLVAKKFDKFRELIQVSWPD